MSTLAILSDAELDAVSGGILDGGDGGANNVGANVQGNFAVGIFGSDLSVSGGTANANGGRGGKVVVIVGRGR